MRRIHRSSCFSTALLRATLLSCLVAGAALAQEIPPPQRPIQYSPYPQKTFPNRVYFGDTHLHTSYSADAGMAGAKLGPEEAYRFARGEEVTSNSGLRVRLHRPLDFLVIADHAENLGLAPMIARADPALLNNPWGKQVFDLVQAGKGTAAFDAWLKAMQDLKDPFAGQGEQIAKPVWQELTAAAEKYNEPGRFTTIIGFEWTSGPNGNNLHRNVLFRDGKDKADQRACRYTYLRHEREPRGPVEVDGRMGTEDHRRPVASHPAQRQPVQRPHVPRREHLCRRRSRWTKRLGRASAQKLGAAVYESHRR